MTIKCDYCDEPHTASASRCTEEKQPDGTIKLVPIPGEITRVCNNHRDRLRIEPVGTQQLS